MPIGFLALLTLWSFLRLFQPEDSYDSERFGRQFGMNISSSDVCHQPVRQCPTSGASCPCCFGDDEHTQRHIVDKGDNYTYVTGVVALCVVVLMCAYVARRFRGCVRKLAPKYEIIRRRLLMNVCIILHVCRAACWVVAAVSAPLLYIPEYRSRRQDDIQDTTTPQEQTYIEQTDNSAQSTGTINRRYRRQARKLEHAEQLVRSRRQGEKIQIKALYKTIVKFKHKSKQLQLETEDRDNLVWCTRVQTDSVTRDLRLLQCTIQFLRTQLHSQKLMNKHAIQRYIQLPNGVRGNTTNDVNLHVKTNMESNRLVVDSALTHRTNSHYTNV